MACLGDILDFTTYLEDNNLKVRIAETLKEYGASISNDEWVRMLDRKPHAKTSLYLEKTMQLINQIPVDEGEKNECNEERPRYIPRYISLFMVTHRRIIKKQQII